MKKRLFHATWSVLEHLTEQDQRTFFLNISLNKSASQICLFLHILFDSLIVSKKHCQRLRCIKEKVQAHSLLQNLFCFLQQFLVLLLVTAPFVSHLSSPHSTIFFLFFIRLSYVCITMPSFLSFWISIHLRESLQLIACKPRGCYVKVFNFSCYILNCSQKRKRKIFLCLPLGCTSKQNRSLNTNTLNYQDSL